VIGVDASALLLIEQGIAIDPMLPPGAGADWLGHEVRQVIVTIVLHTRSCPDFEVPIWAPAAGVNRWEGRGFDVVPFRDGDVLAPGVRAIEIGEIAPDDFVLHIETGPGILAIGDAIFNYAEYGFMPEGHEGDYPGIGFVPDELIGDDPEGVNRRTVEKLGRLLDLEFDTLAFSHGVPIVSGGKAALRAFVEANS
jgi:hypothetical protein